MDTEDRLTAGRGEEGWGGWVKKVKGLSKKRKINNIHRQTIV